MTFTSLGTLCIPKLPGDAVGLGSPEQHRLLPLGCSEERGMETQPGRGQ